MIPEHDFRIASVCLVTVLANIQRIAVNIQLKGPLKSVECFPRLGQGFTNNIENIEYSRRSMPLNSLSCMQFY